ncbi:MAG TPA: PEP/pyruvate-binding domain-containing protein [Thermodesulfobacteriota bacterium]|nr:PEP/pyruvate-binding domain-containing protein [Thermodesulfobacteriota bacterium]
MSDKWIFWFEELGTVDNDRVGKKCANLGELTRMGLRIPPGFAISIDGYERFMAETGAGEEIRRYVQENRDHLKEVKNQIIASRAIRNIIESKEMPPVMQEELFWYYDQLKERAGVRELSVAVRSSGAVSMPGQMESYLNVRWKEAVLQKVIQVWGSAFTTRAIAFRLEKGMAMEKAPIGIAVLKMVEAKSAGVVLTVLPTIGDLSKVVVEGNWGLGESVVSGEVNPDQFIVDKSDGTVESTVNRKTKMVVYHDGGTITDQVPAEIQEKPCVDPEELKEIVRIAKQVEEHFQTPQDMEWVLDRFQSLPESLYWVQARPAKYTQVKEKESEYLAELMTRMFKW